MILAVTNKRYRVNTTDIKKLYKVEKKRVPHVPRFEEKGNTHVNTDADLDDNNSEKWLISISNW